MTEIAAAGPGLVEAHRLALDHTRGYVEGTAIGALRDETPCEGWDVRALLDHVISGNLWVGELTAGKTIDEVGDALDGDCMGEDPLASYVRSAQVADGGFRRPDALTAPTHVSYGPVPGEVYLGHRFVDVLVHGWDVAVATSQDPTLPPPLVAVCWDVLRPQLDLLTASGMFGTDHHDEVADDPQSQLLATLGRDPA